MNRHINKQDLINRVRELAELTIDEKSALLELLNEKKTYGLVWENHEEAVEEQLREQLPVLHEVPERRILSEDAAAPNHIIIEAENLHALVALTYTHAGMIDVIYIDPPYNTGNKDFVYNDSYIDSEDSYRHSKWLSFMEKRLRIAKTLLSERGVIFISIDDNEQADLKLLCDEVFGERSFLAQIVWQKIHSTKNDARFFSQSHEYAFVYAKYIDNAIINLLPRSDKMNSRYINKDNDPRGPWQSGDLVANGERTNGHYIVTSPKTGKQFDVPDGKHWVYSEENLKSLIESNSIWFGESGNSFPRKKRFLCDVQDGRKPNTLWLSEEVGNNQTATREVIDIFNERGVFDFPKPVTYIKQMLSLGTNEHSTILDFFAGSGTTLHATMQLNEEDGGHRQCILVTNNENGICEQVTYERNKRVIQGYTTPKGEQVAGLSRNNLRYYKADFISRDPSSKNKRELVKAATDLLCIKEDMYQEAKVTCNGKTLRKDYARRFVDGNKEMIIIYEPAVIKYIVESLNSSTREEGRRSPKVKVYVFSDGRYAFDDDFREVIDRVELCALPDAILNAYQRVLPRRKERSFEQPETEIPAEWTEGMI